MGKIEEKTSFIWPPPMGVKNVRSVVNTAREIGVPYVTLYAFSAENQNGPRKKKKSGLMRLLEEFLKKRA